MRTYNKSREIFDYLDLDFNNPPNLSNYSSVPHIKRVLGIVPYVNNNPIEFDKSCRQLYNIILERNKEVPKIITENPSTKNWKWVWKNLNNKFISSNCKSLYFNLIHNSFPTNEFKYKIGISITSACNKCNCEDTIIHRFTSCNENIKNIWFYICQTSLKIGKVNITPELVLAPDFNLRSLRKTNSIMWLIGNMLESIFIYEVTELKFFNLYVINQFRILKQNVRDRYFVKDLITLLK